LEESDIVDEDDEEEFMEAQSAHVFHLKCSALRDEKAAFDEAILSGSGMPCPGCGVIGRKDGMCTHMTCSGCSTVWCYLCGLSVEDCDKAPRYGEASREPIYGHNEDWAEKPGRCPMYISMIAEVDDSWNFEEELDDEDADYDEEDLEQLCLNKFHRFRTLQKLHVSVSFVDYRQNRTHMKNSLFTNQSIPQALRNELGEEKWSDLRRTFASVRNSDFSNEEIAQAGNVPLFTRPDTSRNTRRRTDDIQEDSAEL
jgi:hypothetical protein